MSGEYNGNIEEQASTDYNLHLTSQYLQWMKGTMFTFQSKLQAKENLDEN